MNMIWQFPQMALGKIFTIVFKAKLYTVYKDAGVYSWRFKGGLSLGKFIFVPFNEETAIRYNVWQYIKHEYGHTMQSRYLGWFYLPVIGLPSLVWAGCFKSYRKKRGVSYYKFYTERWADMLGGVTRND